MKRLVIVALLVALLLACSTLGTPVTTGNALIQMPHYTITTPADQGWYVQLEEANRESIFLNKKDGPILIEMKFGRVDVFSQYLREQPATAVADDFRLVEERRLSELGAKHGQFQLKNVTKNVRTIGDRIFYTLTYERVASTETKIATLYLLFPRSKRNDIFFIALYSESIPPSASPVKSYKAYFEAILQGMVLR